MTNDAILKQFGYTATQSAMAQLEKVKNNTNGFDYVEKHLITLHDQLQSHLSYVALSSSKDYFKIKNEALEPAIVKDVNEMILKWSQKYKIEIEKVPNKETYYVLGYK
jgi:hypothetical protein